MRGCYASRIAHPVSRRFRSHRRDRLGRILRLQVIVVGIGQLPSRAIELDLFQRAQRDRLRAHVIVGIVPLVDVEFGNRFVWRTQDRQQHEVHRARGQQDANDQLDDLENGLAADAVELVAQPLELGR